jgi:hypothetical protein
MISIILMCMSLKTWRCGGASCTKCGVDLVESVKKSTAGFLNANIQGFGMCWQQLTIARVK